MTWTGSTLNLEVAGDLGGDVDLTELREAVEPLLTPAIESFVCSSEGVVTVQLDSEPDQAEKDAVDVAVAAHAEGALGRVKAKKNDKIDARTEELIVGGGFVHNGHTFSTSANAQSKWHAIQIMNLMASIVFPLAISTKDEHSYEITSSGELSTMYGTMVATGKQHHDSGKALKDAIDAATTIEDVEAIVDNR